MMAISPTPELTLLAISSLRDCRRSSAASVFIMAINATAGGLSRIRTHFSLIANQPLPALNRSGSCRRNHPRCRRSKRGNLSLKSFFEGKQRELAGGHFFDVAGVVTKSPDQPLSYLTLRSHKVRFSALLQNISRLQERSSVERR